jgi:hypothetical protein
VAVFLGLWNSWVFFLEAAGWRFLGAAGWRISWSSWATFFFEQLGAHCWLTFPVFKFISIFHAISFFVFWFCNFHFHLFLGQLRDVFLEATGSRFSFLGAAGWRFSWSSWVTFFLAQLGDAFLGAAGWRFSRNNWVTFILGHLGFLERLGDVFLGAAGWRFSWAVGWRLSWGSWVTCFSPRVWSSWLTFFFDQLSDGFSWKSWVTFFGSSWVAFFLNQLGDGFLGAVGWRFA